MLDNIASICVVEQGLSLYLSGQLYRRADAFIADAALSNQATTVMNCFAGLSIIAALLGRETKDDDLPR